MRTLYQAILVCVIIAGILGGLVFWYIWDGTHYAIDAGKVAVVTDQWGGILRIEKGPLGWAPKSLYEYVKYYDVMVRTEDMISPAEEVNGTKIVHPQPLGDLRYGAVPVSTTDVPNIYLDISVQWHIDITSEDWKEKVKSLYLNYPGEDYETRTILPGVRDALRNFANQYTCDELVYTKVEESSLEVTAYVQGFLDDIPTLNRAVVIDKVFIRARIPPVRVQEAYLTAKAAELEAEAILTLANAKRDASIKVAEGQKLAIELVVNATERSVYVLVAQNLTASEAIQYLTQQYIYDSLKKIAVENPDWKIFINMPELTYTYPVTEP